MPSLTSSRARELARLTQFEEENFTRVMMKKSEAKRRLRDEEDVALGGGARGGGRRRTAGGLADEFGDVLRSVGRERRGVSGDGYEELRVKGRKGGVLARSRAVRTREDAFGGAEEDAGGRKRSRFEKERRVAAKKANKARR
jgi:U3 small nucleolar ribonucleoprotein protein LCP5